MPHSRWRSFAILDLFGAYLGNPQRVLAGFYHSAKFGYDRVSSCDNIRTFQYLAQMAQKRLFTPPKLGFGGNLIL